MSAIELTVYDGAILGPIAELLGKIMNWIYVALCTIFHVDNIPLSIVILIITVIIYMCLLPLTIKQQKFSKLSQKMQPEIKAVQEKYKGRQDQASMAAMQQETQLIYDKYGVSPTGSCVQMLIQMPILFALYRVFYNIPAYVESVKGNFTGLVDKILTTGPENYTKVFTDLMSKENGFNFTTSSGLTSVNVADKLSALASAGDKQSIEDLKNYIVDILYKLPSNGWNLAEHVSYLSEENDVTTLAGHFSQFSNTIQDTFEQMQDFNYLFGMNISDTPWNIIRTNWDLIQHPIPNVDIGGCWLLLVLAVLIPALSYVTQLINIKLMPTAAGNDQNDAMARQMKTMNMMMPLMSLFLCFTVPVGLGIYWIFSAVVRGVQQFFVNKHIKNLDLDDVIEKNQEKAKKKREKRGIREEQIRQAAQINTRSIGSKANLAGKGSSYAEQELALEKAEMAKQNAAAGSLAAKANLVKDFNERNNK